MLVALLGGKLKDSQKLCDQLQSPVMLLNTQPAASAQEANKSFKARRSLKATHRARLANAMEATPLRIMYTGA